MYQTTKYCVLLGILFFLHTTLQAQSGFSPYTIKGIGDINTGGLTNNQAMGGLGISYSSGFHLNTTNPALLYKNRLSVFEIGIVGDYKDISTNELTQSNFDGGFNYVAFGFPVIPDRWSFSMGAMPYSTVNYNISFDQPVSGSTDADFTKEFEGSGGFTRAFIGNGIKINKNFSVGVTAGFLFGSVNDETTTNVYSFEDRVITVDGEDSVVQNVVLNNTAIYTERTSISDFTFTTGIAYKGKLKEKTFLNLGIIYELGGEKNIKQFQSLRNFRFENAPYANDTIVDRSADMTLPSAYGVGISFEKQFHWTVGADVNLRQWDEYRNHNGDNEGLENSLSVAVGGEFIPDISSVDSYLNRITYRLGFNYEETPYIYNNEQIKDFGINFGVSLPVRNFSSLNLAFKAGQRGTTDNNLIKEQYFKVYLGVTFNDKWFVRRKFD